MKIVIVSHGSFNPVHLGHLEMMIRARQALTAAGHEVCGGIFAITSTQHIERKGAHALSNALRLALLRRACADGGCEWLRAADGSASHSADRFMKQLNFGAGILGVSVQGSDVQLRYPRQRVAGRLLVVVARAGERAEAAASLSKNGYTLGRDAFLVDAPPSLADASSTRAREAMAARDTAALARLCGDGVAQQLLGASGTPAAAQAPHAGGAGTAAASTGHAAGGGGADGGGGEDEDDRLQVTGHQLSTRWREMPPQAQPVVGFYGHARGAHRSFSNFFEHAEVSCELPRCCGRAELQASGRSATLTATFGEKLIMLCKAAAMRDYASFDAIARARTPTEAKRLGRGVSPWDERLWTRVVCTVAHAIVLAKARGVPHFRAALLQTGRALIAEATSNDRHWGIGLDEGHASVQTPALWRGSNILGWALMEAREVIAGEAEAAARGGGGGGEDGAGAGAGRGGVAAGQVRPAAAAGERSERRKRRAGKLQGGLWE